MTDRLEAKNRNALRQGQGLKTQAQVFSKKIKLKERSSKIVFIRRSFKEENEKGLLKFFARFRAFFNKIFTVQKMCCPRAKNRAIFDDLRLRGQSQELDLRAKDFKMCSR